MREPQPTIPIEAFVELREYIESFYPVGTATVSWLSATGEKYREILAAATTREALLDAMKTKFDEYAKGRSGTLYWRITPELDKDACKAYMRLLISDKPVLDSQQ